MRRIFCMIVLLLSAAPAFAVHSHRHTHATHRKTHRHHSKWNVLFWPSRLSQLIQNKTINDNNLERYQNQRELDAAVERGDLIPIQTSHALAVDPRLLDTRRGQYRNYVRPWTMNFLLDLSEKYYAEFHQPLLVDSAVRTVEYQKRLRRRNSNAAPIEGETASSHLAGLTVDLARRPMSKRQIRWMEMQLLILHNYGWVETIEEHRQLCFHIMVSPLYGSNDRGVTIEPVDLPAVEIAPGPETPADIEDDPFDAILF